MIESVKTFWKSNELKQNTHVIICENGCIVIDAGCPISEISCVCDKPISAVFITHGHYDHIKYIEEYDKLNIPIYANKNIVDMLNSPLLNASAIFGVPTKYKINNLSFVKDGDEIEVLSKTIKCFYTPGHTIDGMCYLCDNCLFTGDTLFSVAIGRVDLPSADERQMIESLQKINLLEYSTVYTGHGRTSTKNEQNNNISYYIELLKNKSI